MRKKNRIVISIILVILLLATTLIGCNKKAEEGPSAGNSSNSTDSKTSNEKAANEQAASDGDVYPLKTDKKLTYWVELHQNLTSQVKNLGETPFAQEWQKRTGVKLEFIHPVTGKANESFNLMIASGELPDIVEYKWYDALPGGPNAALADGSIIELNKLMDKYAPNLKKYLEENPDVDKDVKTDEGQYYVFPFIRGDESLLVTTGPQIRKDWLDELGLPIPETYDDWHTMLKAFKEKKGAESPFSAQTANGRPEEFQIGFAGGFGLNLFTQDKGFYVEGGKVQYSWLNPEVKDYLVLMNEWFKEGLLDKNFMSVDSKTLDSKMITGKAGATVRPAGSGMGRWIQAAKSAGDNKYELIGAQWPVKNKGEIAKFSKSIRFYNSDGSAAISANCKTPELAAQFLDYLYSDEGKMFVNFGTEGVSYNMTNGYPTYTDEVMKNSKGLAVAQAMSLYIRGNQRGPFVQDPRYLEQYYALPQQKNAVPEWRKTRNREFQLPMLILTIEEADEAGKILSDLQTYTDEMYVKFVMGEESIDKVEEFQANIKKMKIDRAIEIYQAAYDRYQKR